MSNPKVETLGEAAHTQAFITDAIIMQRGTSHDWTSFPA
jgi:hypothetical protein